MRTADFSFDLPDELIAQEPAALRSGSRLLCLDGSNGALVDSTFTSIEHRLATGDLLVMNDVRVMRARLRATKASGGAAEVLVERVLTDGSCLAHIRASRAPKSGSDVCFEGGARATVMGRQDDLFELDLDDGFAWHDLMREHGHVPLPPYIRRDDGALDAERYQTVYARDEGAVAAPTAGLHFDDELLARLRAKGVELGYLTLYVGAGTFAPLRVEHLDEHRMHAERVVVTEDLCQQVRSTRERGGRVVAVGTTCVRALETASHAGSSRLSPVDEDTRLFIRPGYGFRCVDAMVTNFHLPESTLLMLVCAFAGTEHVLAAYRHAVANRYRFFSYGDAMFVTACPSARPPG